MSSSTFRLTLAKRASDELEHAKNLAAGGIESSARNAGTRALMLLAEALGLGEPERALINVLIVAQEGHAALSDYDVAHLRGDIKFEGKDGVARILPLAELRTLLRWQSVASGVASGS